jgi:hypothetical protein
MLIGYTTEMMQINSKLNLIIRDSTFSYLPHDTLISNTYKTQLLIFTEKWGKADSSNKTILQKIENLQTRVANAYLTCSELTNETNYRIKNFSRQLALPEENPLWNSATKNKNDGFVLVLERSAKIASRILSFYLMNKRNTIIIFLLITLLLAFSTQTVTKKLTKSSNAFRPHQPRKQRGPSKRQKNLKTGRHHKKRKSPLTPFARSNDSSHHGHCTEEHRENNQSNQLAHNTRAQTDKESDCKRGVEGHRRRSGREKTLEAVNELVKTLKEQKTNETEAEAKAVPGSVTKKDAGARQKEKTASLARTSRQETKDFASTTSRSTQKQNNRKKKAKGYRQRWRRR